MRLKRNDGSIRKRGNGVFQIRYSLGFDPLSGKRNRIEVKHKGTFETAKIELRRLLRSIDTNEHVDPTKIRLEEYLRQWLNTVRAQVAATTYERYVDIVNHFLIKNLGACQLSKLTPNDIQRAYNKWEMTGRRDNKSGGLSPRTRIQIHRILRSALKNAVRMRLITNNPADAVMPPRARKVVVSTLSIEQSTVLLQSLKELYPRLYIPVLIAVTTGMRRGEILALRWKNVDLENKSIRVVESLEQVSNAIRFKAPKTEKTRAIMLPDYVVELLQAWKQEQAKELSELGVSVSNNTLVYCRWNGEPFKPDCLSAEFRTTIRKIKTVPIVRFHDLRHSHATQLLIEGIHPKIAQERLGHSSIKTTLDLYSHVTDTMQSDAVSKLDTAFRSAIKASIKISLPPKLG